MLQRKYSQATVLSNVIICALLLSLSYLIIVNRQYIVDQIMVWQFISTSQLDNLVERSGMNDYGKFLYHASHPNLDATQTFNDECDRVENTTSILGCFKNNRIYIYDISDPQLDGIREVTATHETLHAAYDRLSTSEQSKVNVLLEAEYSKLAGDKTYTDRMAFYARTEPGERDNELHSVIGTEIADISPELETYYNKYFSNRQKVVALNTKYSSIFIDLKNKANELATQLSSLSTSINSRTEEYNSDAQVLNNDIASFKSKAASGGFKSTSQFNSELAVLSSRVTTANELRDSINNDKATFDSILKEYNSIATESKTLYNTIDSTLAPATSVSPSI